MSSIWNTFGVAPPPGPQAVAVIAGQDTDNTTRVAYILSDRTADRGNDPDFASNFGYAVTYQPLAGVWVVGVDNDLALTSVDGINYSIGGSHFSSSDVIYIPGLGILAVGQSDINNGIMMKSVAGTSWSPVSTPWTGNGTGGSTDAFINGLAYSPDLNQILALGSDNFGAVGGFGATYMYSNNLGASWTIGTNLAFGNNLYRAAWSSSLGLWAAVGPAGDGNGIYSSPNGITWTPRVSGGIFHDIAWSPTMGQFLAVTGGGARYSSNGTTWTVASNSDHANITGVCWCPTFDQFIVHVGAGARMLTNIDNWFDSANSQVALGMPTNHGVFDGRCFAI